MKILLVGIAGDDKNFLLALPALQCYLERDPLIRNHTEFKIVQWPYIPEEDYEKRNLVIDNIQLNSPDMVGFSCYVWNMGIIKTIVKRLKVWKPMLQIVYGGPEIHEDSDIELDPWDYRITGEGELPFQDLLRTLILRGGYIDHPPPQSIEDLTIIPSPYLTGCITDEIFLRPHVRANLETQRGCNFRCAYCLYHKNLPSIRYRDVLTVVDEIEYVYKRGVTASRIVDANFLSKPAYAKFIVRKLIEREIKMSLVVEVLPQFVDEEIANLFGQFIQMYPENRIVVGMGIQTINKESLRIIKRSIPLKYFEQAFDMFQEQEVLIKSDIILGLPRETRATYFKTLEYITEKMRNGRNYKEGITLDPKMTNHVIYETPFMPRSHMVECLRLNAVAFRLLCSLDGLSRMKLRDMYFKVKDAFNVTNIRLLEYFVEQFSMYLSPNSLFNRRDFPYADDYYENKIHEEIPDEWLIHRLRTLLLLR
jgi:anaerobic magnesium-protoporphyrin IX monomethyl ester cyclase